ncbi:hypothetical protein A2Y99_04180 [Candidatus Gottesmanbacteria bacterium RBG_13_37_7]|uniref:Uncharacterized protein n=1 Tax=Candidatus Gottesmanbacteria bacterium RBG_13_37_7 TaxID=1798369 RepID=A0A1F5YK70_9BACT|nr:MAG: hypothetical protein A2Y99_04180 [Candidatus Gottesmanbacteria bacterium RBG_13_37_7]
MDKTGSSSMSSIRDILSKFNPLEDKYISREFQAYGIYLSEELNDIRHKALYMKLARDLPRAILEKALSYVKDSDIPKKGALFMWKLKQLGAWEKKIKDKKEKIKSKAKKIEDIPF